MKIKNKNCTKCGNIRPISEFHKCNFKKSGYQSHCVQCRNKTNRRVIKNKYEIHKDYVKIFISSISFGIQECVVDRKIFNKIKNINWCLNKRHNVLYARGTYNKKNVIMHRFIIDVPEGKQVDHKDFNGLNNRLNNLRICNNSQNNINRSICFKNKTACFKGVSFLRHLKSKPFSAQIMKDKKPIHIGYFKTEGEAARAYNQMAKSLFGEFAYLNKV